MSNNCEHFYYIGEEQLSIRRGTAQSWSIVLEDELPEGHFLQNLNLSGDIEEMLLIERPTWYGQSSGTNYETLLNILDKTRGHAQIVLIWESSDITGLEVDEGVVVEKSVKFVLHDQEEAE
jgi:hypothetical protein